MNKYLLTFIILIVAMAHGIAQSQSIYPAVRDNQVYVYHLKYLRPGQGFNIYRKDNPADTFRLLSQEPVMAASTSQEMLEIMGEDYLFLSELLESATPVNVFLRLYGNNDLADMAKFTLPSVARALGNLFIDSTAQINSRVTYRIEFLDANLEPGGDVAEEQVYIAPHSLKPPAELQASNKGTEVTLKWNYEREHEKIARFQLYRELPDGSREKVNQRYILLKPNDNSYEYQTTVPLMQAYETFYITVFDVTGAESNSTKVRFLVKDNQAPPAVKGITIDQEGQHFIIRWLPSEALDLKGYNLYRENSSSKGNTLDDKYVKINKELIDKEAFSYLDSTLQLGSIYKYVVKAVDVYGNESVAGTPEIKRANDNQPPKAVINLKAEYLANNQVSLKWENPRGQTGFKTFMILRKYRYNNQMLFSRVNQGDLKELQWIDRGEADKGFKEGLEYQYGVIVVDADQNISDTTITYLKIPDLTPPQVPANILVSNEDGRYGFLSWASSASADTKYYRIYKKAVDSVVYELTTVEKNVKTWRDSVLTKGKEYLYAITAIDSLGNESEQRWSDTLSFKDFYPPSRVRNLRFVQADDQLKIIWEPVSSGDLVGYNLYHADIPTGVFTKINSQPLQVTEFEADALPKDVWFRVRAIDSSGNEGKYSEPVKFPEL
ncbi:MAG: hypothetical protein ACOCXH_10420 [Cyclobacteriaceae bacterium]